MFGLRGARSGAAGTQNAFVETVQFGTVFLGLEALLLTKAVGTKPRLNALVLSIEVAEVRHEIRDDLHVRQVEYSRLAG